MNREQAVRNGFYEVLKGMSVNIPGEGPVTVPVFSNKDESEETLYAIITSQFAQNRSNLARECWKCNIEIEIYHVQQNSATYDYVDLVSDKIEQLINPLGLPNGSSLPPQSGWQLNVVQLESVNSMTMRIGQAKARLTVAKMLQYSLIITKI